MKKIVNIFWKIVERIVIIFLKILCKLTRQNYSESLVTNMMQFVKFGLVGVSNTLISYVIYAVLVSCSVYYLAASIAGFVVSVANSFYWNNKYVFKQRENEKRSIWKAFLKTFLSYASTGLVLNNILLYIGVDVLLINELIAPLLILIITIPLNFLLNKFWAFRENKDG